MGSFPENLFGALKAAPTHTIGATFEWDDRGFFGSKKKRYMLTITQLTAEEARQRFNVDRRQSEYLVIGFVGELPPKMLPYFNAMPGAPQGYSMVYTYNGGFVTTLGALRVLTGDWQAL